MREMKHAHNCQKKFVKKLFVSAFMLSFCSCGLSTPKLPTPADLQKQTMRDMRRIATSIEAYDVDMNHFPETKTMEELVATLGPTYAGKLDGKKMPLPTKDQWGNSFRYIAPIDGVHYWLISFGADKKPDADIYDSQGIPNEKAIKRITNPNDDIILGSGGNIRSTDQPSGLAVEEMKRTTTLDLNDFCSVVSDPDVIKVIGGGWTPAQSSPGAEEGLIGGCRYQKPDKSLYVKILEPTDPQSVFKFEIENPGVREKEILPGLGDDAAFVDGRFVVLKGNRILFVSSSGSDPEMIKQILPSIVAKM